MKPQPNRKSPRADWHDYNGASYFVTICTKNRIHYFGEIQNGIPNLSPIGEFTRQCVEKIDGIHDDAVIPIFVVMPNHVHLIIVLDSPCRAAALRQPYNKNALRQPYNKNALRQPYNENALRQPYNNDNGTVVPDAEMQRRAKRCGRLSHIIGQFKTAVLREAAAKGIPFGWQARFHDHIIRNDDEMKRITLYIKNNPIKWNDDCFS